MVTEWGMSEKVGPISYGSDREIFIGRDMASHVNYSEKTASIIDEEVSRIVNEGLEKARKLLSENKKLLENMARLLIERETIFSEEVEMLMKGKSVAEIMEFMDENEKKLQENPFSRRAENVIIKEKPETVEEKGEEKQAETKETEENKTDGEENKD